MTEKILLSVIIGLLLFLIIYPPPERTRSKSKEAYATLPPHSKLSVTLIAGLDGDVKFIMENTGNDPISITGIDFPIPHTDNTHN